MVDADVGVVRGSTEMLRACADTLVEKALRYLGPADDFRLLAFRDGDPLITTSRPDAGNG